MNLLYLAGALAGVGLLVGLNLLLFGRVAPHADAAAAEALLAREVPGFRAARSIVSANGDAVLLEDSAGAVFLVVGAGDKLVSRRLRAQSLTRASRQGAVLDLRLSDVTFARARFAFSDEQTARSVAERLQA